MKEKKIQMICSTCGSTKVRRDANVHWDVEDQKWHINTIFDNAICEDCECERSIQEVQLKN